MTQVRYLILRSFLQAINSLLCKCVYCMPFLSRIDPDGDVIEKTWDPNDPKNGVGHKMTHVFAWFDSLVVRTWDWQVPLLPSPTQQDISKTTPTNAAN